MKTILEYLQDRCTFYIPERHLSLGENAALQELTDESTIQSSQTSMNERTSFVRVHSGLVLKLGSCTMSWHVLKKQ